MNRFPGYYYTEDLGYMDIKIEGHRVSTENMEEILSQHSDVVETAVVGVKDPIVGEKPVGFIVSKAGVVRSHLQIEKERIRNKRAQLNSAGKIIKYALRKIVNGEDFQTPSTIVDETVIDNIRSKVKSYGLGTKASSEFTETSL